MHREANPVDVPPVVAAMLAEADRLDELALTIADFAEVAQTRALAARTRDQATALAMSPDIDPE